jgi:hypothetical protein
MPPRGTLKKVKMADLSDAPVFGSGSVLHNANNLAILWNSGASQVTFHIHVLANLDPGQNNDNPLAPVVVIPKDFCLYFYNGTGQWSTSHETPLYGPDGDGGGNVKSPPYLASVQNGQLVGVTVPDSSGAWYKVPYTTANGWQNPTGADVSLRFYINDLLGQYADNIGSVDCDVVVAPPQ